MIRNGLFASGEGRGSYIRRDVAPRLGDGLFGISSLTLRKLRAALKGVPQRWRGGVESNCPMDGATQAREPATEIAGGESKSRL